jgi:iron-sulfur cluster repair protein YtfE (RIC family)
VAWSIEMRRVHARLRAALRATRAELGQAGTARAATRDLLLFCHGFCTALTQHHEGEDHHLFPAIAAGHPELRETLRQLAQDHELIGSLVLELHAAVDRAAGPGELDRHLGGIAAIMESHFRYEERRLLSVLETLDLEADPNSVFGPL